jgi:hypothetical protein
MSEEGSGGASGVVDAGQQTRDAAKYLIAAFGAVGAVLVSGLSLTALPSGRHPVIAAIAVLVATFAIGVAINLVIRVVMPYRVTLSELAKLQQEHPDDELIVYLNANRELFGGLGSDLVASRDRYLAAVDARAGTYDRYIAALNAKPRDPNVVAETQNASEVASAEVEFLAPLVVGLVQDAWSFRVQERFARVRRWIGAAALIVVAAAAVYAWASTAPAKAEDEDKTTIVKQTVTQKAATPPNCVAYYLALDHLADDDARSFLFRHPSLFPLEARAKACGFTSRAQLTNFVEYLADH